MDSLHTVEKINMSRFSTNILLTEVLLTEVKDVNFLADSPKFYILKLFVFQSTKCIHF